jgi:uncharacterized membrane protein YjgN (DUF898 family)
MVVMDLFNNEEQESLPAARKQQGLRIHFSGSASDFFSIWIVNTFLSVVTLGIYSAWAKVRTNRYFYGNTSLEGYTFEYTAEPLSLLKGRLLIGAIGLLYLFIGRIDPRLTIIPVVVFIAAFPWVYVQAHAFHKTHSVYRGVGFGFSKNFTGSYKMWFKYGLLILVTLGLAFPFLIYKKMSFEMNHSRFGQSKFRFNGDEGEFFRIYLKTLWALIPIALTALFYAIELKGLAVLLAALSLLLIPLYLHSLITAELFNFLWNRSSIDGFKFRANMLPMDLLFLKLVNTIALAISFGFLRPWTMIRVAQFKISCLRLVGSKEGLESFLREKKEKTSALAEVASDAWDMDIGFW